jgi:glutathione S-transferase
MVLKLYGWFGSTPALLVALILHEKKVPFEWIDVDLIKGDHKGPAYVAKNTFGQVPVIVSPSHYRWPSFAHKSVKIYRMMMDSSCMKAGPLLAT